MRAIVCSLSLLAACGSPSGSAPGDAAAPDAAAPDAAPPDATPPDAAPPDAAPPDAAPLRCVETTEMLVDFSPRRILHSAALGDTLYFSSYDPGDFAAGGRVQAITMETLTVTSIVASQGLGTVRMVDGWIYGTDDSAAGKVWRYRPGQPIETLASNRTSPFAVTADATQVYWSEGTAADPVLMRAPLTGGPAVPIIGRGAHELAVDDQFLYSGELVGPIRRYRKDNWFNNWSSEPALVNVGMALDGDEIVFLDDRGVFSVHPPATAPTSLTPVGASGRHYGMTLAGGYVWLASDTVGVQRVPRTGGVVELVTPTYANGDPVFIGGYLTWNADGAIYRCRP